jgi:hypothetical protein
MAAVDQSINQSAVLEGAGCGSFVFFLLHLTI